MNIYSEQEVDSLNIVFLKEIELPLMLLTKSSGLLHPTNTAVLSTDKNKLRSNTVLWSLAL